MGQKCEDNCGLCALNEIIIKAYPENLKKIVGAVCYLAGKKKYPGNLKKKSLEPFGSYLLLGS